MQNAETFQSSESPLPAIFKFLFLAFLAVLLGITGIKSLAIPLSLHTDKETRLWAGLIIGLVARV